MQNLKKDSISNFQEFIYIRTYSRWLDNEGRREKWGETPA